MSLSINSIVIRISAKAFNASFELSQLQVYSVNTSWSISDLRFTRIQDPQRGEVTAAVMAKVREHNAVEDDVISLFIPHPLCPDPDV